MAHLFRGNWHRAGDSGGVSERQGGWAQKRESRKVPFPLEPEAQDSAEQYEEASRKDLVGDALEPVIRRRDGPVGGAAADEK